jgi:hypothetical protein
MFCNTLRPIEIISFYLIQKKYPENILEITFVDPICNTLILGLNQCLIMASHNTKVKKFNSIAIPLFDLPYFYWGFVIPLWVY